MNNPFEYIKDGLDAIESARIQKAAENERKKKEELEQKDYITKNN